MNETSRQLEYINKAKMILGDKGLKYFIKTFGCQMNEKQSETLAGVLEEIGYTEAENEKEADFVLYNTCTVRESAELKVYGRLGHLKSMKKNKPNLIIALCGCMTQREITIEEIKKNQKHVDIVFGNFNIHKLPELIIARMESDEQIIDIWKEHGEIVEDLPSHRKYDFKSCVNIMYGCNNFCTYCIVPYVRGRERSRKPEDIVKEIESLVSEGVVEVMLLGQNVNSYGRGLEEETTFAELLRMINEVEGLERIRFMTSHPKDISEELIYAIRDCDKVCNQLHLPVQAGNNKVLKEMNRNYTREKYLETIKKAKEEIKDLYISTDMIIGFPGETEEEFEDTIKLVEEVEYNGAFTFIFSVRTGTKAANMENQISDEVKSDRFNRLKEVLDKVVYKKAKEMVGKETRVLVEQASKSDDATVHGRTDSNYLVHFKGDKSLIGKVVSVKIKEAKPYYLIGEKI
ncbi:MAG: tRNA (N6-isopentenyl adenosine(37)-C2)-methylthiotransferase MiaB [Clostridia bacterium]|jgi:tRNA-2-methylthio-N6-dimethylallyladenosine synthase|nr:tRNA (N6-isopentenyl adenosine(37)-C2)-methylthiotransferase MiaB [Clostridia bacterium]